MSSGGAVVGAVVGCPRGLVRGPRGGVVPWITGWSGEVEVRPVVVGTARGIRYADESFVDRDSQGVLWYRMPSAMGVGEPQWARVHPRRQRRAMRKLLCQVCGGPADQDERGTLWLMRDRREDWPGWPGRMNSPHPPVCLRCARIAVKMCPWLLPGWVAVRAWSSISGVAGGLYSPDIPRTRLLTDATLTYDDPHMRWVVASQLMREIHEPVFVDL